jgi:hypothetical protein
MKFCEKGSCFCLFPAVVRRPKQAGKSGRAQTAPTGLLVCFKLCFCPSHLNWLIIIFTVVPELTILQLFLLHALSPVRHI